MTPNTDMQVDQVLGMVRADIAEREVRVEALNRELDELRTVERYLSAKTSPLPTANGTATIAVPTSAATTPSTADPATVTHQEIANAANKLLRAAGPGNWVRASEVARRLVPAYNPEDDARNFENRIFSYLSRKDWLVKIGRGKFALKEYFDSQPNLYQGAEDSTT